MKKIYSLAALAACLLFAMPLTAQVDSDVERDNKNTPNRNSIFNDLGKKKNENNSYAADVEIKNSVGFCPTMLLRQKVFFIYEYAPHDIVILDFGLGKAFGNDLIQSTYFSAFSDYSGDKYLQAGEIMDNSTYLGSGMLVHAGVKLFFDGTAFDGSFFEFYYRHEKMEYRLNPTVSGYRIENGNTAEFTMNALAFGYGYKGVTGSRNQFTHEFYMNCGIKNFTYTQFNQIVHSAATGYSELAYQRTAQEAKTRILPSFNMGYIFGFGW